MGGAHKGGAHKGAAAAHRGRAGSLGERHGLNHLALGGKRSALVGHSFRKPGGHLHDRIAKLHGHHWRSNYNHVVIVGVIGGVVACELYCEFDVPVDVYPEFVAAVDVAQADTEEEAEYKQVEEGLAEGKVTDEEARSARVDQEKGWNKAVAILEEAAAQEDKEAEDAQKAGEEVATVIDQPDEQVDVVLDEEPAKKG
jgi:hypothetical protein